MRWPLAIAVFLAAAVMAPVAAAQEYPYCPPGETPRFSFGFAALKGQLGAAMGEPTSCEFGDPNGTGDTLQLTTEGLAFYRKASNAPTFTNGWLHWALSANQLVGWIGGGIDPPARAAAEGYQARVVELTNLERQKAGLAPLQVNANLTHTANDYARVLSASGCFAHTCGPVPDLRQRVADAGYTRWMRVGENIAGGQRTPEAAVAGWMDSPGHRANILNPAFTEIGVGHASGGPLRLYWVQVFGARGR